MSSGIRYRYALNGNEKIVDIFSLTAADRKDYECISCGQILRPVMGEKRQKHFRHQADVVCSQETYLHKLAKLLFHQVYRLCLDSGSPFEIEYWRPRVCTACDDYGPCKLTRGLIKYDLTRAFSRISLETSDNTFIPDVLLSNERGERLYVEIAVTHFSTESKRSSGVRIIELVMAEEGDLQLIPSCLLSESDHRVKFVNFQIQAQQGDFSEECKKHIASFILWPSGKSMIEVETVARFKEQIQGPKAFHYKIIPSANREVYIETLERAYSMGHKVTNCFLCRYHAKPTSGQWARDGKSAFCKFLKHSCNSNDAAECQYYRPGPEVFSTHEYSELQSAPSNSEALQPSRALAGKPDSIPVKES